MYLLWVIYVDGVVLVVDGGVLYRVISGGKNCRKKLRSALRLGGLKCGAGLD
jgi:hypothetical protein